MENISQGIVKPATLKRILDFNLFDSSGLERYITPSNSDDVRIANLKIVVRFGDIYNICDMVHPQEEKSEFLVEFCNVVGYSLYKNFRDIGNVSNLLEYVERKETQLVVSELLVIANKQDMLSFNVIDDFEFAKKLKVIQEMFNERKKNPGS